MAREFHGCIATIYLLLLKRTPASPVFRYLNLCAPHRKKTWLQWHNYISNVYRKYTKVHPINRDGDELMINRTKIDKSRCSLPSTNHMRVNGLERKQQHCSWLRIARFPKGPSLACSSPTTFLSPHHTLSPASTKHIHIHSHHQASAPPIYPFPFPIAWIIKAPPARLSSSSYQLVNTASHVSSSAASNGGDLNLS